MSSQTPCSGKYHQLISHIKVFFNVNLIKESGTFHLLPNIHRNHPTGKGQKVWSIIWGFLFFLSVIL